MMFGVNRLLLIALIPCLLATGFLYLRLDAVTLQRDAARTSAAAYAKTLEAYRAQYAAQAAALKSEKGREIARQERLLKTLNLIGALNDAKAIPAPDYFGAYLDSLYGPPAGGNTAPTP